MTFNVEDQSEDSLKCFPALPRLQYAASGCTLVQTKNVDFFRIQRSSELTHKLSPGEPRFIYNYAQSKTLKICANHLGRLSRQEPHDTRSPPVQALGVPTGSHGAFRDYQVDAITSEISPKYFPNKKGRKNEFLLRRGRLVEGVIRSVNNLLEKFHQSFFLYLLTSANKFVSVGVYKIAFAPLVAPLPLVAASLYSDATKRDFSSDKEKNRVRCSHMDCHRCIEVPDCIAHQQVS